MDARGAYLKPPPPQVRRSPLFRSLPEAKLLRRPLSAAVGGARSPFNYSDSPEAPSQQPVGQGHAGPSSPLTVHHENSSLASLPSRLVRAELLIHGAVPTGDAFAALRRPSSAAAALRRSPAHSRRARPTSAAAATQSPATALSAVSVVSPSFEQSLRHFERPASAPVLESPGNSNPVNRPVFQDKLAHCGTLFMVEQAREVKKYEEKMEAEQEQEAFLRERRWALLRMRQVEKDTRLQREAVHKKRLQEAQHVARQQAEEVFLHEKEVASHNERKERNQWEGAERQQRRRLAWMMWAAHKDMFFRKAFAALVADEVICRFILAECNVVEAETKFRAFFLRVYTSDRASLMQQEKSERIVCMRYVTAYSAWKGEQEKQTSNLVNAERKQRYKVYDSEGLAFGEIDAIKQGILAEIAREARRKQEARLAAIREMEQFHLHQRRAVDDEESGSRTSVKTEEQLARNQLRLDMLSDRKTAQDAFQSRQQRELQSWKQKCFLEQQPLVRSEAEARQSIRLDESTEFRVLQLFRVQLWDEIMTPLVLLQGEECALNAAIGKKMRVAFDMATKGSAATSSGANALRSDTTESPTTLGSKAKLSKQMKPNTSGVVRMQYDIAVPFGCPATWLCPGVTVRRKTDQRHYTQQSISGMVVNVRARGGGVPGDEAYPNASSVSSLKERSAAATLVFSAGGLAASTTANPGSKAGSKASAGGGGGATSDGAGTDASRLLASQMVVSSLRMVDSSIYDDENNLLCTVDSCEPIASISGSSSIEGWKVLRAKIEDEQREEDGLVLCSMSFPQVEKDNTRIVDKVLQSLIFVPNNSEPSATQLRKLEVEVLFSAPSRRKQSVAGSSAGAASGSKSSPALLGDRSRTFSQASLGSTQNSAAPAAGGTPTLVQYRLVISIQLVPVAPFVSLASAGPRSAMVGTRTSAFFDPRAPVVKNAKPMIPLFPTVAREDADANFWETRQALRSCSGVMPSLGTDFNGGAVRLRFVDHSAPEDILLFVSDDEFIMKRDEIRYNPPPGTTAVDPMVCARVVLGKLAPGAPTSTKDIWFALAEAPSFWSPTTQSPSFFPAFVLQRFLARLHFTTTSSSTIRRTLEVTVATHRKFGGTSSCIRVDVGCAGSTGLCCGSWVGLADPAALHVKYVESHLATPEHLRPYLDADTVALFPRVAVDLNASKLAATDSTVVGPGAIRFSVVDRPMGWDVLDIVERSPNNTHGLLLIVAIPQVTSGNTVSLYRLMWSPHGNDESAAFVVGTVKRFSSLEGKFRPGILVELTDACRLGAVIAVLNSVVLRTSVPEVCDGLSKLICCELNFSGDATAARPKSGGGKGGESGDAAKGKASPSKGGDPGSPGGATSAPNVAQLLGSSTAPMRVNVSVFCVYSSLRFPSDHSGVIVVPRLEDDEPDAEESASDSADGALVADPGGAVERPLPQRAAEAVRRAARILTSSNCHLWCPAIERFDGGTVSVACFALLQSSNTSQPSSFERSTTAAAPAPWDVLVVVPRECESSEAAEAPTAPVLTSLPSGLLLGLQSRWDSADDSANVSRRNRSLLHSDGAVLWTVVTPSTLEELECVDRDVHAATKKDVHRTACFGAAGVQTLSIQFPTRISATTASAGTSLTASGSSRLIRDPGSPDSVLQLLEHLAVRPEIKELSPTDNDASNAAAMGGSVDARLRESCVMRVVLTDTAGGKHQLVAAVELIPKNLPSYFSFVPRGPLVWRSGTLGYLNDMMPLFPRALIEDEDTERTGELAYLRVEPLSAVTSEDRLVFIHEKVPDDMKLVKLPMRAVEFVESIREGEIRRYHVRMDDGAGGETEVGTCTLLYGTSNPTFNFVFAKGTTLDICSQVLRQLAYVHASRFPYRVQRRQFLVRFNAMDGDGVVDTKYVLELDVGPPLMYVLPLYETVMLKHSDRVKQVLLFPKLILGVALAGSLGTTLHVHLDTRAHDEEIVLLLNDDIRENIFLCTNSTGKYICFNCGHAASIFASVGAQRHVTTSLLGVDDLPVAPTPSFDGVVFAKVVQVSKVELLLELANGDGTHGQEVLPAATIPQVAAKLAFRSSALEPLPLPRTAALTWTRSSTEAVTIATRLLIESGEPVGTLSTEVDSLHVFQGHPHRILPDGSIGDTTQDMLLGKESELVARVIDPQPGDRLYIGCGALFEAGEELDGDDGGSSSTPHYSDESRTATLDGDDVAWVDVSSGHVAIRFSQCPVSVAQDLLRRLVFVSDGSWAVGRVKLLEIQFRVYKSQPTPSMLHVQLTVHRFPLQVPRSFSDRLVVHNSAAPVATSSSVLKCVQWATNAEDMPIKGLVVDMELLQRTDGVFKSLLDAEESGLTPASAKPPTAPILGDRLVLHSLPSHLSFGGAGKSTGSITLAGKGAAICTVAATLDGRRLTITFTGGKQVTTQLVLDVLWCVQYEFEAPPPADAPSGAPPDVSKARPRAGGKSSVPSVGAHSASDARNLAVKVEVALPLARGTEGTDAIVLGSEIIPVQSL